MHRFDAFFARAAVFGPLALAACKSDTFVIADDWGPPAGYALVTGRVTNAAGNAIPAAEVLVTRCSAPHGGVLGVTLTRADGSYRIIGTLAPVGLFPWPVDTVRVRCIAIVNRSAQPLDSLEVRFAADSLAMPTHVLNLTVP